MRAVVTLIVAIAIAIATAGFAAGQAANTRPQLVKLPLDLPAVGNVDAVRTWRFGRLERITRIGADEIIADIRLMDDRVVRVSGPRGPLADLARRCGWVSSTQTSAGRATYVERMIAFDADENDRIIAVISLEPMNRNRVRLRNALVGT